MQLPLAIPFFPTLTSTFSCKCGLPWAGGQAPTCASLPAEPERQLLTPLLLRTNSALHLQLPLLSGCVPAFLNQSCNLYLGCMVGIDHLLPGMVSPTLFRHYVRWTVFFFSLLLLQLFVFFREGGWGSVFLLLSTAAAFPAVICFLLSCPAIVLLS